MSGAVKEVAAEHDFHEFAKELALWSQDTFGTDQVRGPAGPLKHLVKEAKEAMESPGDVVEYADCLFLVLDASRRAGFSSQDLLTAAFAKLEKNKARKWPKPTSDEPVEHIRRRGRDKKDRNGDMGRSLLSIGQVAKLFGVSTNTVKKWCETGLVKYNRIPNGKCKSLHRRVDRDSLLGFAMTYGWESVAEKLNAAKKCA